MIRDFTRLRTRNCPIIQCKIVVRMKYCKCSHLIFNPKMCMFTEGQYWTADFTDWRLCFQIDSVLCFRATRTGSVQSQCQYQLRSRSVITFLYCSSPLHLLFLLTPRPPSYCHALNLWRFSVLTAHKLLRSYTKCTQDGKFSASPLAVEGLC
jgi:hypothetical protein